MWKKIDLKHIFDLQVGRHPHVEVFLEHPVCPVVLHLGGVHLVLPLVHQGQVPGQPAFVILTADNVATGSEEDVMIKSFLQSTTK